MNVQNIETNNDDGTQAASRKVSLTILHGISEKTIDVYGGVQFAGVVSLPEGVTLDDIKGLYREWVAADRPYGSFTDWLLDRGFVEEEIGYVYLFDDDYPHEDGE
jgi:hypothetical protein